MRRIQLHCNIGAATSRYIHCKHRHNSPSANKRDFWLVLDYCSGHIVTLLLLLLHHPLLILV